jgi:formate-dependent nitrite reductase cytochrome c552 subunit
MPGEQAEHDPPTTPSPPRRAGSRLWLAALLGVIGVATAALLVGEFPGTRRTADPPPGPAQTPSSESKWHEVVIRKPSGPPVFYTGVKDAHGNPVTMACADCHATREPNLNARIGTETAFFHQGLKGHHGNLACVTCHNPADGYATLRLADGRPLPYTEVMQLCAQCHGPQYRDYQHGAHGGMTGHWDLSKGGRTRANCIDCHNPHAPKYPVVQPAAGPNGRGVTKEAGHE